MDPQIVELVESDMLCFVEMFEQVCARLGRLEFFMFLVCLVIIFEVLRGRYGA